MLRPDAAIAVRDDLHGLGMVECGLVGSFAAQRVANVADIHDARRCGNSVTSLASRVTTSIPTLVVIERDFCAHRKEARLAVTEDVGAHRRVLVHDLPLIGR